MRIRPYLMDDAATLADIVHRSVHAIGALDYSAEQVAAWSAKPADPEQFRKRVSTGYDVLVAVDDNDKPIAFIELESDGHIDHFYCSPDHAGTGVGAALYGQLEAVASEKGIDALYVEASEAARRFFLKHGFTVEHRRDFERAGVPIHNYLMRKSLGD